MKLSKFPSSNSLLSKKIYLKKKEIISVETTLKKLENLYLSYDYLKLFVASPQKIRNWAQKLSPWGDVIGEVLLPDSINFKTHIPELFGLFCERIFGTTKDLQCRCGTYRGALFNKICDTCEIEVTEARVRRYRMGYIQFICPIAHYWYFKGTPNYLLSLLKFFSPTMTPEAISNLLYYQEGTRFFRKIGFHDMEYQIYKRERNYNKKIGEKKKSKFYKKSYKLIDLPPKMIEPPLLISFIIKGTLMKGGFEQFYRDSHLKSKNEASYAQDYCLKILLYASKERDIDFDVIHGLHKIYENMKNVTRKYNNESNTEKYKTKFQLSNFRDSFETPTLQLDSEELKKMIKTFKKKKSKYPFKKSVSRFLSVPTDILKQFSFEEMEVLQNKNLYHFEEFPTLTPKLDALLTLQLEKGRLINRYKYVRKGAEVFQHMLHRMEPESIMLSLKSKIFHQIDLSTKQKKKSPNVIMPTNVTKWKKIRSLNLKIKLYVKQFRIFNSFFETRTNPSWIILTNIPILPPTLRPFIEIDDGELISSDINEIYRLLIIRNNRLAIGMFQSNSPEQILLYARRSIQQTVDSLISNGRVPQNRSIKINERPLRGLTEILEGKFGRFRFTLLGKRIDYSGRSVIAVNPQLKLNQCGLPYLIGLEIFQPILIKEIISRFLNPKELLPNNIKKAEIILIKDFPIIWRLLETLMKESTIFLNRAPTLHKFGVQAFNPFPILGQAIQLHPLVCSGFNADFDGDQMAVHLPLYKTTQLEVKFLMRPSSNILTPSNGDVIIKPSQDIVIGCYYLTMMVRNKDYKFKYFFSNEKEALFFFYRKKITLHTPILVRYSFSNFYLYYEKTKLNLIFNFQISSNISKELFSEKIEIFQILKNKIENSKIYFLTNLGIFFAKKKKNNIYEITQFFFETNPGRILFSNTINKFV